MTLVAGDEQLGSLKLSRVCTFVLTYMGREHV